MMYNSFLYKNCKNFCPEILHLRSWDILACGFPIFVLLLSGFVIRVILALYSELGSVVSSSIFWKSLWRSGANFSQMFVRILQLNDQGQDISFINAFKFWIEFL